STLRLGVNVSAKTDLNITSVKKNGTATTAFIYFPNDSLIASSTFSGDIATFNNVQVNQGETVSVLTGHSGAFTPGRNITMTYPINGTYLDWVNGVRFTTSTNTSSQEISTRLFMIVEINVSNVNAQGQVNLTSPPNNNITSETIIFFNATATITGGATIVNRTLFVWYSNGTLFGTNATTGLSGASEVALDTLDLDANNSYLWNKEYCDSDGDCGFSPLNFSIEVDTEAPIIDIERPIGIIDFGEIGFGKTIFELAIAIAYLMLDQEDPLLSAFHVVKGYFEKFSLTNLELKVLFPLICARLCMSVCSSAYQIKIEPENDYLTINEKQAWDLLFKLEKYPLQFAYQT
ncbi:hypothetical protein LCGC14_3090440, partial [marine sediment metagenome]